MILTFKVVYIEWNVPLGILLYSSSFKKHNIINFIIVKYYLFRLFSKFINPFNIVFYITVEKLTNRAIYFSIKCVLNKS